MRCVNLSDKPVVAKTRKRLSKLRKNYILRLVLRSAAFILALAACFLWPQWFRVIEGWGFFRSFSPLHILWVVWIIDMICQLVPIKDKVPLGSQKLFRQRFKPIIEKFSASALRDYIVGTTKAAYKVFILWCALLLVLGVLYFLGLINNMTLLMISIAFYVCDLICVLIWCPFRLMMKNRCCTTCRIFNWDHLMMFSPLMFVKSFYAQTLFIMSLIVWLVWELSVMMYPERFWEYSNAALKCSNCTDKLCTQYCKKLR